ncbi:c-type cytochrome [Sulfurovum sp. zt1-1]|uniref:C-type cytochrome n=1 Tax=Sulfurovum zhangzhouensis TaxID=3019067 RepID=A0ABT7QZK9_9BACT|nr:c-type cytochrome [Sulfurovum zhangzhouensis]MDM5272282.1 c-type cytochrome [Sulfurovum zhangzhouensis]
MRELKILAIVVFFTLVTYYGVEPFAHSKMHKHVEGHGFVYDGTADVEQASDEKKETKKAFWNDVNEIAKLEGNVAAGEAGFAMCMGCHMDGAVAMGGVVPPSLEHAGALYDKKYLIAVVKNPAMAMNTDHKFADPMMHPMGPVMTMFMDNQSIADVVAYLKAKKAGEVTPKEAFTDACSRCHAMRYAKMTQLGDTPTFKYEKDALAYKINVLDAQDGVKGYMGKLPPDLSIIIRARSEHFLETFIENPQTQLPGTSMPRVGLNEEGYEKVKEFLTEIGDPSKPKREAVGPYVILFFVVFAFLAFLWKKYQWRDLH